MPLFGPSPNLSCFPAFQMEHTCAVSYDRGITIAELLPLEMQTLCHFRMQLSIMQARPQNAATDLSTATRVP